MSNLTFVSPDKISLIGYCASAKVQMIIQHVSIGIIIIIIIIIIIVVIVAVVVNVIYNHHQQRAAATTAKQKQNTNQIYNARMQGHTEM